MVAVTPLLSNGNFEHYYEESWKVNQNAYWNLHDSATDNPYWGERFLELGGNLTSIKQMLPTTHGKVLTELSADGSVLAEQQTNWQVYSTTVTATSEESELEFQVDEDKGMYLDAVDWVPWQQ